MKWPELKKRIEEVLDTPAVQLRGWIRFLRLQIELCTFCARQLRRNNFMAMSAALSFRTIFAMIPALILGFLVLRSIGVVEDGKQSLRAFLESSGVSQIVAIDPNQEASRADGDVINVADEIETLIIQAEDKLTFERIGPIGALLMIWTAMTLLITLESSLNRIFEAPRSRAVARRVVLYWATITLGPVLIVAASQLFQTAVNAMAGLPGLGWAAATLAWIATTVVGMVVVAMAYKLIPNTHVHFSSAFGGALIAVPLWLLARWGFAIYVERFVLNGNLYGVLGLFPLFMLWINISWTILLFGAQIAHTAANVGRLRSGEDSEVTVGPSALLAVAVSVARTYLSGDGPTTADHVSSVVGLPSELTRKILDCLVRAEVLCLTNDEAGAQYVLLRPPEHIHIGEILDLADPGFSESVRESGNAICSTAGETVQRARESIATLTLASVASSVVGSRPPTAQSAT